MANLSFTFLGRGREASPKGVPCGHPTGFEGAGVGWGSFNPAVELSAAETLFHISYLHLAYSPCLYAAGLLCG